MAGTGGCVAGGERVDKIYSILDYSYRSKQNAGNGFIIIGDAYGFLDAPYLASFVTALCLIIDKDGKAMSYARAGHPPLLLQHGGDQRVGAVEELTDLVHPDGGAHDGGGDLLVTSFAAPAVSYTARASVPGLACRYRVHCASATG